LGELFRAKFVEDLEIEERSFVSELDKRIKSRVGHGLKLHRTGKCVGSVGEYGGAKIGQYVRVTIKIGSVSNLTVRRQKRGLTERLACPGRCECWDLSDERAERG
jgi:hypothetical protein